MADVYLFQVTEVAEFLWEGTCKLVVSSEQLFSFPSSCGSGPDNLLYPTSRICSCVQLLMAAGIGPFSLLFSRKRMNNTGLMLQSSLGIDPVNWLKLKPSSPLSTPVKVMPPNQLGMGPDILL